MKDAVETPMEDEVVNAVEDPGYGKRAMELNSIFYLWKPRDGASRYDVTLAMFVDNLSSLSF